MWGYSTYSNLYASTEYGSCFVSNPITITLPIQSKTNTCTHATVDSTGGIFAAGILGSKKTSFQIRIVSPVRIQGIEIGVSWNATGIWK